MRYVGYLKFIIVFGLLSALSANATQIPSQTKANKESELKADKVVIEIVDYCDGMCGGHNKQVYFRLYESGRVQYEELQKSESKAGPVSLLAMQESQVSADQFSEIIKLAEQPGFLKARKAYPKLIPFPDAIYIRTISYSRGNQSNQVALVNYSFSHPKASSYYPASLMELIRKIEEIKSKIHK